MSVRVRLTPARRAHRLVVKWGAYDADGQMHVGIAAEIEAAEAATNQSLRTRNANLHAQLECAVAAIRELRLKDAQRQSVERDLYRNVAGKGVRLGLAALRSFKEGRSTKI